jgi:hypothetical protein
MACAPLAARRASPGGGLPEPDSVGSWDRLIGPDPKIVRSADWRGASRSSGSSNGSRQRRSQKARLVTRVVMSLLGPVKVIGRGAWRTRKSPEDSRRTRICRTDGAQRAGPVLAPRTGAQAGTAGLRDHRPYYPVKGPPGNRTSELISNQIPGSGHGIGSHPGEEWPADWFRIVGLRCPIRCMLLNSFFLCQRSKSSTLLDRHPSIRGDRSSSVAS